MRIEGTRETLEVENADLPTARFTDVNLAAARFENINLATAVFTDVSLAGARLSDVSLKDVAITNANLDGMTIEGIPVLDMIDAYRSARATAAQPTPRPFAVTEIKAFVPARDFALSRQFYKEIGFVMKSEGGGVAYFCAGNASFLLQDGCDGRARLNLHLLVRDVDAWWTRISDSGVAQRYNVQLSAIETQPWRMRDFTLTDPSGTTWTVAQNVD